MSKTSLDLAQVKVLPLSRRKSEARLEDILISPDADLPPCSDTMAEDIRQCAARIKQGRGNGASIMLIYGAHLIKNGAAPLLIRLMEKGWISHLATNGAGVIHDWEFAYAGVSTENVRENVAVGEFGAWDETGRNIHLAVLTGALTDEGFGEAVGKFVLKDGVTLPAMEALEMEIRSAPTDPRTPARAELLQTMWRHRLSGGRHPVNHRFKDTCVLAQAYRMGVPLTVHPGIGYDIISVHPMFNGAALGRAAETDFREFAGSVEGLTGGVVLSIGSAIMGPQVFEKSMSCVNNIRLQSGRRVVAGHAFYVVDLQDGGNWDWSQGEPPKDNPAYYLRFCKSYARMGGTMRYLQVDNVLFLQRLLRALS
jgi:hypothetical protein